MQLAIFLVALFFAFAMALPQYPNQYLVNPTTLNMTELQEVVEIVLESLNMTTSADNVTVTQIPSVNMANSTLTNATFPIALTNATLYNATTLDNFNSTALNVTDLSPAQQLIINSQLTGKYPGRTSSGSGLSQMSPFTLLQTNPSAYQQLYGAGALVDAVQA